MKPYFKVLTQMLKSKRNICYPKDNRHSTGKQKQNTVSFNHICTNLSLPHASMNITRVPSSKSADLFWHLASQKWRLNRLEASLRQMSGKVRLSLSSRIRQIKYILIRALENIRRFSKFCF